VLSLRGILAHQSKSGILLAPSINVIPAGHTGPFNDIIPIMNAGLPSITSVASIARSTCAVTARAYRPSTVDRTGVEPEPDRIFISDEGMIAAANLSASASALDPLASSVAGILGNFPRVPALETRGTRSRKGVSGIRPVSRLPSSSPGPVRQAK